VDGIRVAADKKGMSKQHSVSQILGSGQLGPVPEQASTHWICPAAEGHLSEKVDLEVVRDNLGHANISTTSIYLLTGDESPWPDERP
jgi:site-specific recombinase XerD